MSAGVVDVHLHFLAPDAIDAVRRHPGRHGVRVLDGEPPRLQIGDAEPTRPLLRGLHVLDAHLDFFRAQGIDTGVFGPLMDVAGYDLPAADGAAWCRTQNEALAAALRSAPGAHQGLATLPLQDPVRAAEELRVAVKDFGLRGAMVDPHALGRALGHRAFDPLWMAAAELDAPVVLHPYALEAVERFGAHYLHNLVGYPFETTLAAGSLVLGGTFDRVPGATVVLVHGGGFLPYHVGRFDRAYTARPEARAEAAGPPSSYLRRFHYDSLVQRPEALAYLVGVVGADRVMLGSDHPFWLGDPEPLRVVRDARLSPDAERLVLGDNAARVFHLRDAT
ncbi:MAG: amidohydrolase family protein [Candidatus Rokubacteria bacterium]|nr:amidohydrolase family protein [Candidatus Rokubacteria bacterium]